MLMMLYAHAIIISMLPRWLPPDAIIDACRHAEILFL